MKTIATAPRQAWWPALCMIAALAAAPQAQAFNQFLTAWQNAYPASTTDQTSGRNGCQVCHSDSNGEWNAYGDPLRAAVQGGTPIGTAITDVEGVDSDGNGDSNLTEINANSQPGWTVGANNPIFDSNGNQIASIDAASIGVQPPLDPVVGNQPPVAVDDAYSTAFETTLTVVAPGVLENDSDPDGDAITAVQQSNPANGTATLNADGSFTYTPNAGFSGDDTFTYVANDGTDDSNVATVTITVAAAGNQPPVAVDDTYSTPFQTVLNEPAPGVLANDTDADGDPLTAVLQTDVSNGVLQLNADGSFTYSPNAAFSGQDSFTYFANDGNVNSNTAATVTISVGAA
ncbi:MAG: cadherin-like domain-containing protein, partial [Thiogranum sp.]